MGNKKTKRYTCKIRTKAQKQCQKGASEASRSRKRAKNFLVKQLDFTRKAPQVQVFQLANPLPYADSASETKKEGEYESIIKVSLLVCIVVWSLTTIILCLANLGLTSVIVIINSVLFFTIQKTSRKGQVKVYDSRQQSSQTMCEDSTERPPKSIVGQVVECVRSLTGEKHKVSNVRFLQYGGPKNLCKSCKTSFAEGDDRVKELIEARDAPTPCKACDQTAHMDYDSPHFTLTKKRLPETLAFFVMAPVNKKGCGLWLRKHGYIWLEYGDVLAGRCELIHAGIAYPGGEKYKRMHLFVATEEEDYDNSIYTVELYR